MASFRSPSLFRPGGRNGRVCQAQFTEYCPFEAKATNRCSLTAHRIGRGATSTLSLEPRDRAGFNGIFLIPRHLFSSYFWSGIDGRCVSVLVRKEFLIDAKIRPHFRRIWTHVQGLRLRNDVAIGFRHSFLLQHILSPRWYHHFDSKRVEPARILE